MQKWKKGNASLPKFVQINFTFKITPVSFFVFPGTCRHRKFLTSNKMWKRSFREKTGNNVFPKIIQRRSLGMSPIFESDIKQI